MKYFRSFLISAVLLFFVVHVSQAQQMNFSPDSVVYTGYQPAAIVCSDFDTDGFEDIAVAIVNEASFDPVAIFMNDGNGKIASVADSMYQNTQDPKGIATADINNDEIPDLAASIYQDSTIVILLGNGDGTFARGNNLKTPTKPGALILADFDNDQKMDLAVVSRYGFLMTFKGDGQGSFSEPVVRTGIGTAVDITAHDMNKDGYADIIIGTGNVRGVGLYLNDGAGHYNTHKNLATFRTSWFVKAADFNNDGNPDIAAGSGSWDVDNVYVLLADTEDNYVCPDTLSPGTYVADISVADFNNDNNPDLMVADRNGLYILSGAGDGSFSRTDTIAYDAGAYQAKAIESADVNNDGKIDLIIARESQISIYYNKGIVSSISDKEPVRMSFTLFQNYPNPFNPTTKITYQVSQAGNVTIDVYNIVGQKITTLVNERKRPGIYEVLFDAGQLSSGTYFYKLTIGDFYQIRKMMYLQ